MLSTQPGSHLFSVTFTHTEDAGHPVPGEEGGGGNLWTASSKMWSYCCGFPSNWPVGCGCGLRSPGVLEINTSSKTKKKRADEEWIGKARRERNWKRKMGRERAVDKCPFEENISRLYGTQADLPPPSSQRTHLRRWKQGPLWGGALALSLHPASGNWKTWEYGKGVVLEFWKMRRLIGFYKNGRRRRERSLKSYRCFYKRNFCCMIVMLCCGNPFKV